MTHKVSESCQIQNLTTLYDNYFPLPYKGQFVDVGAHDGYSWSNTWGLAEVGWRGMLFEPYLPLMEKCQQLHTEHGHVGIYVYSDAIGKYDGVINLYPGDGMPTTDRESVDKLPPNYGYKVEDFVQVSIHTLNKMLNWGMLRTPLDLLSIDVEGGEWDVLQGFSIRLWQPKMVIIETHSSIHDPGVSEHRSEIFDYFKWAEYNLLQDDGLNSIYISPELEGYPMGTQKQDRDRRVVALQETLGLKQEEINFAMKHIEFDCCKVFKEKFWYCVDHIDGESFRILQSSLSDIRVEMSR